MTRRWLAPVFTLLAVVGVGAQQEPRVTLESLRQRTLDSLADIDRLLALYPPVVTVSTAAQLTAALDTANPGTTIRLTPHAVMTGAFVVRRPGLTIEGTPGEIASLIGPFNGLPTLEITASNTTVRHVAIAGGPYDVVSIGRADSQQTQLSQVPSHVLLEHVEISGHPTDGAQRGIGLHGAHVTIRHSEITNIFKAGVDSQAIAGWNGPGPYTIEDSRLEAASEVILFGGADPTIPGVTPSDIVIRRNVLTRPVEWRGQPYNIKNLFELKTGRRVTFTDNLLENNWLHAQAGFAIVLTPVNQGGGYHEAVIEDVLIANNVIRNTGSGVNITGWDYRQGCWSGQLARVTFRDNLFEISKATWGGQGFALMMGNGPRDIVWEYNTILADGNQFIYHYDGTRRLPDDTVAPGGPVPGFIFRNNVVSRSGIYGVMTMGGANGFNWQVSFPDGQIEANVLGDFGQPWRLPASNTFLTEAEVLAGIPFANAGRR